MTTNDDSMNDGSSSDNSALPPQFKPSSTPSSSTRRSGADPVRRTSAVHRKSPASQAFSAPETGTDHKDSPLPPSFSPASEQKSSNRSAAGRSTRSSHTRIVSAPNFSSPANPSPTRSFARKSLPSPPAAPSPSSPYEQSKKRKPRKIILKVIAALLALILIYLAWVWIFVSSNLVHKNYLSSAADTSGNTWLILGSDARDGTTGGTADQVPGFRTDTIMVLTKPSSGPASLISIPRDSYVQVAGKDSKINAVAELYGYTALVQTVEGITGQKIDHVVSVGFGGLQTIVDALGGVNLCYDRTVDDSKSGLKWTAGCRAADGQTALAMSRMRYSDPEGDFGRTKRQRMTISAIMKKTASPAVLLNPFRLHKVMKAGLSALTVDQKTSTGDLISLALAFKSATGDKGVTGTVYYSSQDYRPASGIGSCVLLNTNANHSLFLKLVQGSQPAGTVGGYLAS